MSEYRTDEEQLAQLRDWWKENGRFIITGIALGVAILVGFNYWTNYKRSQAEQAGLLYEELLQSVNAGDREGAVSAAGRLTGDFGATSYADQSHLALAKLFIEAGDIDGAIGALSDGLGAQGEIGKIARLRLARVRLSIGDAQAALDLLGAVDAGRFAPLYDEVRGDAHESLGDLEAARDAYQRALDADAAGLDRPFVQMKLNALGLPDKDA